MDKEESPFYYDPEKHGSSRVDRMKFFASIGSMELDKEAEEQLGQYFADEMDKLILKDKMKVSENAANPPSEKAQELIKFAIDKLKFVYRSNDYQSPSHPVGNAGQFFAGKIDDETLEKFDHKLSELIKVIQSE